MQIVQGSEDDGFGRTGLGTSRSETNDLAVVAERALKGASGPRQGLRPAVDDAERTAHDAISSTIADVVLHIDGIHLRSEDGAGGTRLQAAGVFAVLAD